MFRDEDLNVICKSPDQTDRADFDVFDVTCRDAIYTWTRVENQETKICHAEIRDENGTTLAKSSEVHLIIPALK